MPSGKPSDGKRTSGCLLPGPLGKLLLALVALLLVFYLALCTGLLSPLIDSLVSRAASSPESSVRVYGIRTDLFWRTTADSVVVTGIDGLVVKVDGSRITGSLPGYLLTGHVRGIDVERLDILLPPLPLETAEPDSLSAILRNIDVSVVATTDRLSLDYGRITYPEVLLLDSMALETSVHRTPSLELEVAHAAVELPGLGLISGSGHLELDDLLLSIDSFSIAAAPGSATLSGWLQGADGSGSIDLSGRAATWTDDMPVSGWADFSGHLGGSISDPLIELTLPDGAVRALNTDASLSADTITFDFDTLRVDGLVVESDMLSADISGSLSLAGMDWNFSAGLGLTGLDLRRLVASAPASALYGSAVLTAYGDGGRPRSGALTLRLLDSRVDTIGLDSVYVRLGLSSGGADFESFVGTPDGSASVSGYCELGSGWRPVSYSGKIMMSLPGVFRLDDIIDAEGSVAGIEADLSVSGAGGSFTADGSASLGAFDFTGLSASAVSWTGSVGIRDEGADISGEFSTGELRILPDNGVGLPGSSGNDVSWIGAAEMSSSSARVTGVLTADNLVLEREPSHGIPGMSVAGLNWDGSFRSSGGSSDLAGTLTLALAELIPDEPGDTTDARIQGLNWEGSGGFSAGTSPRLYGILNVDSISFAGLDLSLETEIDLQRDTLLMPVFVLSESRDVNLQAAVRAVIGQGLSLDLEGIRIGIGTKLKLTTDGEFAARVSGDSIFLDTLWLKPPIGLLTCSGRFGPGNETVFQVGLNDIDLSGLMNVLSVSEGFSGIGNLTISAETGENTISASIIGSIMGPSYGKWSQSDSLTVDISITESDLNVNGLYIWYDGHRSGLQARIDDIWEDGGISIRPRGLAWFELELNNLGDWLFYALPLPVKTSGAYVNARVEYTRGTTTNPPDLNAYVTARIERLFVTSLGLQLPSVSLYILYPDTTTSRYNSRASLVSGTEEDGFITIQFLVNVVRELPDIALREYQLNANLDHWRTVILNTGQIELSGYLHSSGDDLSKRPEIQGRITVDQGVISYSPGDASSSSSGGDSELPFDLKVEIRSDRGLWFRSSMANIELSADLRILTQSRQLTVSGIVQTVRGKVRLLQKDFDITHGTIEVRQGLPPEIHLDIHAVTTVRDVMSGENYDIEIVISGDPANPQILLSGTGPAGILAQEDILSLLAVGLTYGELQQMDSSTVGSELEFVAQSYVGQLLASHIRDGIGLHDLVITPELLSDSTALTVKVGKYVLPDLYISYTDDFFSPDPGIFSAQFYISRDVSILGSMKSTLNGNQEPSIELHYTLRY